jgi:hypothetical protein
VADLRDPSVNHEWLWTVGSVQGEVVPPCDYSLCVRLRLGACITDGPQICSCCGDAVIDSKAIHSSCCALCKSTAGHNAVCDAVLDAVHLADPIAYAEAAGLIPSRPTLRPADMFSAAALPVGQAALDIGIMSPHALGAGSDCCEAMHAKRIECYAMQFDELSMQGVRYRPLAMSCYGRLHPETARVLVDVCQKAVRRHGFAEHLPILQRLQQVIGARLQVRLATMARSCLPRLSRDELQVLLCGVGLADRAGEDDVASGDG